MYKKIEKLTSEQLGALQELYKEIELKSVSPRIGANGNNALSIYKQSRWYDWNKTQKDIFKSCFSESTVSKSLVGWFLCFPEKTGFLDTMTVWKNNPNSGYVVAYALADQQIELNNTTVKVQAGEGIVFNLSTIHEVKKQAFEQRWACVMTLTNPY